MDEAQKKRRQSAENIAQSDFFAKKLFGEVNKLWRQGKPTSTASLLANLNLLSAVGASETDLRKLGEISDIEDFMRFTTEDQPIIGQMLGEKARQNSKGMDRGSQQHQAQQEVILMWTVARLGRNPSLFRTSADFQRQLLATEHEKAVVSDLHMPLPALVLELEPGIELENRYTGLHPLQAIGLMESQRGHQRFLTWVAYCGAKKTSTNAFDDNYQSGSIGLCFEPDTIYTFEQAREQHLQERAEGVLQGRAFDDFTASRGGAIDGEELSVPDMMRALERLIINSVLYLSQERPSIQHASNRKPLTKAELIAAPARTKVRVSKRKKLGKTRPRTFLLGEGEGTVRVAYKTLVRGHWRHQPYGRGRLLRRTIWIKPHVRHKDAPGEAAAHEYSAQEGKTP